MEITHAIVVWIYRHPKMDLFGFIHYCPNPILEKLANKNKKLFFFLKISMLIF